MRFIKNDQTSIPIENKKFDFIVFYSVFTHTRPDETEKLLLEAKRLSTDSTVIIGDIFSSPTVSDWDGNREMIILGHNIFNDIAKRLSLITVKEMDLSLEPCKRVLYFLGNK
jgi:nucleoside-specific outer membrane channel protein Tsx